jgi:hypothetical protein
MAAATIARNTHKPIHDVLFVLKARMVAEMAMRAEDGAVEGEVT